MEIVSLVKSEIFVTEIAPAQDGDMVVGHDEFVVHTVIKPLQGLVGLQTAVDALLLEGIEYADFNVGMAVDGGYGFTLADQNEPVGNQSHANTAFGSIQAPF